jgi:hypothetical protein
MASPPRNMMASTSAPIMERSTFASSSIRASTSVSTRSMARHRLEQTCIGVPIARGATSYTERPSRVMVGGKRKVVEQVEEGRRRKVSRYSSGDERETKRASLGHQQLSTPPKRTNPLIAAEPVTTIETALPTTPVRSSQLAPAPTPARELLKAGYQATTSGNDGSSDSPPQGSVVRPPTPPRMKPRPATTVPSTTPPHTPGKRCLSPNQEEVRAAKRPVPSVVIEMDNQSMCPSVPAIYEPATPPRHTGILEVTMMSAGEHLSIPSARKTVPSPHRALSSISRLTTPGRSCGDVNVSHNTGAGPSSIRPTVPIPLSFSTPRGTVTKPDFGSKATSEVSAALDQILSSSNPGISAMIPVKEIKPIPKRPSMAPPSKIPVRTSKSSLPPLSIPATIPSAAGTSKPKPKPSLGIAERRPTRSARTTSGNGPTKTLAVFDENAALSQTSDAPVRRKPSYPSSLGSGPLAQPRARLVSGPIQPPRSFTAPLSASTSSQMDVDALEPVRPTPRSVSDPVSRPRSSLSASTSRREGFTADTSRSLAGLSDALAKLKVKRDNTAPTTTRHAMSAPNRPKPAVLAEVVDHTNTNNIANTSLSASTRLTSVHRPRSSIVGADVSMTDDGDRSIAALMSSTGSSKALRGVVAFVDVRTEDGACSGDVWSEMLRGLGAKVSA